MTGDGQPRSGRRDLGGVTVGGSARGPAFAVLVAACAIGAAIGIGAGLWSPLPSHPPSGEGEVGGVRPLASSVRPSTVERGAIDGSCAYVPAGDLTRDDGTPAPVGEPSIGVLGSRAVDLEQLVERGVTSVLLEVAWERFEPEPGCYSAAYVGELLARADAIEAAGLRPVLDAGFQYPPDWVMALPGARFVNQYGQAWHGPVGSDVPDAVFNLRVRKAQATYLRAVAYLLRDVPFEALRVGGLAKGELHYPLARFGDDDNSFWAFSSYARRASPVGDFVPGGGTPASAREFLSWYSAELNGYGVWLAGQFRTDFGNTPTLQVLMPSWGVRPGDVDAAADGLLSGGTRGELTGALNEGLDWDPLAAALTQVPGRVDLYSTWMDAEDQGSDPVYESPVRYLAGLGADHGLAVAGENTGDNDRAAMERSFARLHELGLSALFWMNAEQLVSGRYATLDDLGELTAS